MIKIVDSVVFLISVTSSMKEKKEALEIDLNLSPDLSFISPVILDPSFLFWRNRSNANTCSINFSEFF